MMGGVYVLYHFSFLLSFIPPDNGMWLSLVRALDLGSRGRKFESCHSDSTVVANAVDGHFKR